MRGRIVAVQQRNLGSSLVADVAIGATSITVGDTDDFDDAGQLVITVGGAPLTYTAVDADTGVVTLDPSTPATAALSATADSDTSVNLYPISTERLATLVEGDDAADEEGVLARVPHALYNKIPIGMRDLAAGEGETVEAAYVGEDLVITDLTGQVPFVDGTFIDPTTLPSNPSDGNPPASSPTPTVIGGIGDLFVEWAGITNADAVAYQVHVSVTSGFTPSDLTLALVTPATMATIRQLPDQTPLDYSTTYYIQIVAQDADGTAPASAEASGMPVQVNSPDIAAEAVTATHIAANAITADKLESVLVLGTQIATATSGQRVTIDTAGIKLIDSAGTTLVNLPTDPGGNPTFRGNVITGGITITGAMTIQGATNVMDDGSILTLNEQQASPATAPDINLSWDNSVTLEASPDGLDPIKVRVTGHSAEGGVDGATPVYLGLITTQNAGTAKRYLWLVEWLEDGTLNRSLRILNNVSTAAPGTCGVCLINGVIYALFFNHATGTFKLACVDQLAFTVTNTVDLGGSSSTLDPSGLKDWGAVLGSDGTNPWVISYDGTTNLPNKAKLDITIPNTPVLGTATTFSSSAVKFNSIGNANNPGTSAGPIGFTGAAWDGSNWYVSYWYSAGGNHGIFLQQYSGSTGAIVALTDMAISDSFGGFPEGGLLYDGSAYWWFQDVANPSGYKMTDVVWDTANGDTLSAAYVFGDGTHTTLPSPVASAYLSGWSVADSNHELLLKRMDITVSTQAPAGSVTKDFLYTAFGTAALPVSSLHLQSATVPTAAFTGLLGGIQFTNTAATTFTLTTTAAAAAGRTLVIFEGSGAPTAITITDSTGQTWTPIRTLLTNGRWMVLAYADTPGLPIGTTITANAGVSVSHWMGAAYFAQGAVVGLAPDDDYIKAWPAGTQPTAKMSLSAAGDLALVVAEVNGTETFTPDSGWTQLSQVAAGSNRTMMVEYKVASAAGAVNVSPTVSDLVNVTSIAAVAFVTGKANVSQDAGTPIVINSFNVSGVAPPTSNTFPGGTPSKIKSGASGNLTGEWELWGSGVMRLPRATHAERDTRFTGPSKGDLLWDESPGGGTIEVYDGLAWMHMPRRWWAGGGRGLREAMFAKAAVDPTLVCQNFDLVSDAADANSGQIGSLTFTPGRREYVAVYWPGGACTGMVVYKTVAGDYTDSTPVSGVALMGVSGPGPFAGGSTLTAVAGPDTSASIWKGTITDFQHAWNSGPVTLPEGIYFLQLFYNETATVTTPETAGMVAPAGGAATNGSSLHCPPGWFLLGTRDGQTALASSESVTNLATNATKYRWVGLY